MGKSEKRQRNNVITFRLTDHEFDVIKQAAQRARGGNMSEFVRDAAFWYSLPKVVQTEYVLNAGWQE